jgi:hypothetical protein
MFHSQRRKCETSGGSYTLMIAEEYKSKVMATEAHPGNYKALRGVDEISRRKISTVKLTNHESSAAMTYHLYDTQT